MEDKLRIANKVNKKYKELMNELDENIKQATEEIGSEEAKALLENRTKNLSVEKCKSIFSFIKNVLKIKGLTSGFVSK